MSQASDELRKRTEGLERILREAADEIDGMREWVDKLHALIEEAEPLAKYIGHWKALQKIIEKAAGSE